MGTAITATMAITVMATALTTIILACSFNAYNRNSNGDKTCTSNSSTTSNNKDDDNGNGNGNDNDNSTRSTVMELSST